MKVEVLRFKEYERGAIRGFLTISIEFEPGKTLVIDDCRLLQTDGSYWIALPQRPYETREGTQYQDLVYFGEKKTKQEVQDQVLNALADYIEDPDDDIPF